MSFTQILGNEPIKAYLKHALEEKTVPNTILFSGEDGIGKSLFALALAKRLMYPEGISKDTENKIEKNNHPDLHVYFPEGKIGMHSIPSIRELIDQVFLVPFEAKAKVFIIHDADRMLKYSANALLKTLEEPTLDSYIILLTSKEEDLLPTILSRLSKFHFSALSDEEIFSFLEARNVEKAKEIALHAQGSIGRALELLEDKNDKWNLLIDILAKKYGDYFDLSEAINQLDAAFPQGEEDETSLKWHTDVEQILNYVMLWYRDLHLVKLGGDQKYLFFYQHLELLQSLKSGPSLKKVHEAVEETKFALARNVKLKTCLEKLFFRLKIL